MRCGKWAPNDPHKLTKAAERWLGGGAASGRLRTARGRHVGCFWLRPLRVRRRSRRAARGGRHGGRLLQLRVIALGGQEPILMIQLPMAHSRQACHHPTPDQPT